MKAEHLRDYRDPGGVFVFSSLLSAEKRFITQLKTRENDCIRCYQPPVHFSRHRVEQKQIFGAWRARAGAFGVPGVPDGWWAVRGTETTTNDRKARHPTESKDRLEFPRSSRSSHDFSRLLSSCKPKGFTTDRDHKDQGGKKFSRWALPTKQKIFTKQKFSRWAGRHARDWDSRRQGVPPGCGRAPPVGVFHMCAPSGSPGVDLRARPCLGQRARRVLDRRQALW